MSSAMSSKGVEIIELSYKFYWKDQCWEKTAAFFFPTDSAKAPSVHMEDTELRNNLSLMHQPLCEY